MANLRLPGNLSGQVPDRLAPAGHRLHGAASKVQLHRASTFRIHRPVHSQCQWYAGSVYGVGVRQEHVFRDDYITGKRQLYRSLFHQTAVINDLNYSDGVNILFLIISRSILFLIKLQRIRIVRGVHVHSLK